MNSLDFKLGELNALAVYWNSNIKSNSNDLIVSLFI